MRNRRNSAELRTKGRRGNAIIEMTFMVPWLFFLFVGVLDFGFCAYALISVENAARVAALTLAQTTSSASSSTATAVACALVTQELGSMANYAQFNATCSSGVLVVTTSYVAAASAADSGAADCGSSGCWPASSVTVTYQTVPLIPFPGFLTTNRLTITRTVQVGVKGS
jgi:Flp pilus assembly protein TadG